MTEKEFEAKLVIAIQRGFYNLKADAPSPRSGNQRRSIKIISTPRGYKMYVDEIQAPYTVYTNERWVSEKWGGRENPNLGWFDLGAEHVAQTIAAGLGASLERKV